MENNKKNKLSKGKIAVIVLLSILVTVYIAVTALDFFNVISNLQWAAHLCACITWLIIGCTNWAKTRWLSIANFILSAAYAFMGIMELLRLLSEIELA